jgi:uroporphyrinogen decarboxylase
MKRPAKPAVPAKTTRRSYDQHLRVVSMTSKERVLRSIRHEAVDRTPFMHLGLPSVDAAVAERLGVEAGDKEALLQRLGVDVRYVWPPLVPVSGERRYGYSYGAVHARLHNQPAGGEAEVYPVGGAVTVEEMNTWRWPDPDWFDYTIPAETAEAWRDKAVVAYDMGILFLCAMGVRGMEQIMMDMAAVPDLAHEVFRRIADYNIERTRRFLQANEGVIDIVGIGDDVAGQGGMVISPGMWREFMRPHLEKMVDLCRAFSVVPYFHGCGGFREIYPDFIEMGIPCTGRLQTEAKGNDLQEIKDRFGRDLCLWGAIDGQHVLVEASPERVRTHVRQILEIGSQNSGFVAGPTHSFTEDVPVENILAVYDVLGDGIAGG